MTDNERPSTTDDDRDRSGRTGTGGRDQSRSDDPAESSRDDPDPETARSDAGAAEAGPGAAAEEEMDAELREAVTYDLADLEDDEQEHPRMDDPVTPQRVDLENAAFVALGVLAMIALIAWMFIGIV